MAQEIKLFKSDFNSTKPQKEAVEFFNDNGYVVLSDVLDKNKIKKIEN